VFTTLLLLLIVRIISNRCRRGGRQRWESSGHLPGTADAADEVDINHAYCLDLSASEHLIIYGVALPESPGAVTDAVAISVEDKPVLQTYLQLP
jgi:hypothetical protein